MSVLHVILLAIVQGLAELLPVSSSAHVIVAEKILQKHYGGLDPTDPRMTLLLVMLHTGTMFAVIVYFWPRWRRLFSGPKDAGGAESPRRHYLKMIVLATALTGILGPAKRVTGMSANAIKEREFQGQMYPCDAEDNTLMVLDFGGGRT